MHTCTERDTHTHQNAHSYLYMNALECTYTHQNIHRDTQHDAHTLTKLCLNSKLTDINKNNSLSFQRCETLLVYVQNSKSDYPHEFFSLVKMQW